MELLITVGIIAILSAISLFAIAGSRKSARDGRRKADMESLRSALELYRADCGVYPPSIPNPLSQFASTNPPCPTAGIVYLQRTPSDPVATTTGYRYVRLPGNVRYALCARLEEAPVPAMPASDLNNCGANTCPSVGGSSACNYVIFSP